MRKAIFGRFGPVFAATAAFAALLVPCARAAAPGAEPHVHGPQCLHVEELPAIHPLRKAREALQAKIAYAHSPELQKAGARGGNNVCRITQLTPWPVGVCENSDALFNRGLTDSRTWATMDVVVWMRDSFEVEFGGEASARARLRAGFGHANRIFAQSDTKIQLRVVEVLRIPDNGDMGELGLVAARHNADFFLVLGGVKDALNTLGCTRNNCGMAGANGASNMSYFGIQGAFDHTATVAYAFDLSGENGSLNAVGETIISTVSGFGALIAHELGHSMGGDHAVPLLGAHLPYGKGFIRFPIINNTPVSDAMNGANGYVFSNPRLTCADGAPCGEPETNDMARSLNETRFELASMSRTSKRIAGNFTGMWWTPTENGTGWTFSHQSGVGSATDDVLGAVWYTYDFAGKPAWLIASRLERRADDSFQGSFFRIRSGKPLNAIRGTPAVDFSGSVVEEVGTLSVSFNDAAWAQASFEISMDGKTYQGSKWLTPFHTQANTPNCVTAPGSRMAHSNYQDWWINATEPGWGLNLTHEGDVIFGAWYTYDHAEKPIWRVASNMRRQTDGRFTGAIYGLTGFPLDQIGGTIFNSWTMWTNDAQRVQNAGHFPASEIGSAHLTFTDGNAGTMTYTADGISVTKPISRFEFGASVPQCQ